MRIKNYQGLDASMRILFDIKGSLKMDLFMELGLNIAKGSLVLDNFKMAILSKLYILMTEDL